MRVGIGRTHDCPLRTCATASFMLHCIFTLLTTAAVALRALLGCCAHHAHGCECQSLRQLSAAAVETGDCCAHDHHSERPASRRASTADDDGSGHPESGHPDCDQGACSFAAAPRSSDTESVIAAAQCQHAWAAVAPAAAILPRLGCTGYSNPVLPPRCSSRSARAWIQVWRL